MMSLETILGLAASAAATLAGLWKLWCVAYSRVSPLFKLPQELKTTIDEEVIPTLVLLKKELKPNGGSSLVDKVTRMDKSLLLGTCRVTTMLMRHTVAIFECDAQGDCTFANPSLCRLFGLDESAVLGHGWLNAVDNDDRKSVWDHWTYCITNNIPYLHVYTVCNMETGRRFKVKASAIPYHPEGLGIIGYLGFVEELKEDADVRAVAGYQVPSL